MKKNLLLLLCIVLMFTFVAGGCGAKAPSKPVAEKPKIPADIAKVADDVLQAYMSDDWSGLYDLLHVDIQATIEKEEFIKIRSEAKSRMQVEYKGYALEKHKMIKAWRDPSNSELLFNDVAEVFYYVTVETPKGKKDIENYLYLAKGPDGKWKYLWPKN